MERHGMKWIKTANEYGVPGTRKFRRGPDGVSQARLPGVSRARLPLRTVASARIEHSRQAKNKCHWRKQKVGWALPTKKAAEAHVLYMEQRPSGEAALIITPFLLVGGAHPVKNESSGDCVIIPVGIS